MIERLLAMDGCVYSVPAHRSGRRRTSSIACALGIPADAFVIGAFVNGMKLSRRCLRLWRDVLRADSARDDRVLALPIRRCARNTRDWLAAAGIAAERLVFLPQGRDDAENQARYRGRSTSSSIRCPTAGVNGTLEALDMGVPVVTLVGRRHGERTSYSILA